jgi:hypothetical protein
MKRLILYLGIASLAFTVGAIAATLWKAHSSPSQFPIVISQGLEEEWQWPLTKEIVSRSLQSHSFRTDKLRRNSNDEIVWRWLKESIVAYPQNWVKLNISDNESYGVVLYPLKVLEPSELDYYNKELKKKGLPSLEKGKRYQPMNVYQGNIICPNWSGIIDIEEARLVYFEGSSG